MNRRRIASGVAGLSLIVAMPVNAANAPWAAKIEPDALTDETIREACSERDEFKLCLAFNPDGVWATGVSSGSALFDSQHFPAFRVDQNKAIESVSAATLSLERTFGSKMIPRNWEPRHVTWRAQVSSRSGKWTETPPLLIQQMISGQSMLVRVYLSGGFQRDITFPLVGFCKAATAVYASSAPPLACNPQ